MSGRHGGSLRGRTQKNQPEPWAGQKMCPTLQPTTTILLCGPHLEVTSNGGVKPLGGDCQSLRRGLHVGASRCHHPIRAGRRALPRLPSKVDSAQNNLLVQAPLKIATLRRRLWQGRVGRGNMELRGLPGQVLMTQ